MYRAVDSGGKTPDLMLSAKRDGKAAVRFFRKMKAQHTQAPRIITVGKNAAYPVAIETLKADEMLTMETELRQSKYLNNIYESQKILHRLQYQDPLLRIDIVENRKLPKADT